MQMLNQQIAAARLLSKQRLHFCKCRILQLTPFWLGRLA
jgi:hypothetical protein